MVKYLLIFLAGGSGCILRFVLGGLVQRASGTGFPTGTLVVNVTGCLAMGFLATAWSDTALIREEWRLAILIGLLGGYTTFSSFGRDTIALVHEGERLRAGAYVVGSVALSLGATWLGAAVASRIYGAPA